MSYLIKIWFWLATTFNSFKLKNFYSIFDRKIFLFFKMYQIETKYKASLPKTLLNKLLRVSSNSTNIPFQLFLGLINGNLFVS